MMSGSWLSPLGSRTTLGVWALGVGISAAALSMAGCAKAQARMPEGPPLNVPPPPERVIVAVEEPEPSVPEEPPAPPPVAAKPPPPTASRPAARPESKPEPVAAAPEPKPAEPRTLKPADSGVNERTIREHLAVASRNLAGIDYRRLNSPRRSQYDQSKRFIEQAEQALRERNLVFAKTLADKAAVLAAELAGR